MKISIQSLTLTNFKGVRNLHLQFDADVTSIYGRNRTGKTTVADAINWCLFGKDSKGNTKFGIRTRDKDGEIIQNISHEVEMVILCDDIRHTLQRILRADGTYAYFVDAGKVTAGDYKSFVNQFVGEETFRAVTTPTYFTSLPWQDQRKFLSDMVGTITNEQIAQGDHRFDELLGILTQTSIEAHLKHISYQIKQTQSDLDRIPVRLEEQHKAMPEGVEDIPDLDGKISTKQQELARQQADLAKAQVSGTDDARMKSLRDKLNFARKRIDNMERSARNQCRELQDQHDREVRQSSVAVSDTEQAISAIANKIQSNQMLVERTQETLAECEKRIKLFRQQWADNKSSRLQINEEEAVCPTCGQPLPEDQLKAKIEQMKADFNIRKKNKVEELKALAKQISDTKAQAEKDITDYQSIISQSLASQEELKNNLKNLKAYAEEAKSASVKTYEEVLSEKPEYLQVKAEIASLEQELDNPQSASGDSTATINDLKEKITATQVILSTLQTKKANIVQRDRILALIDGIEKEREELMKTLDRLQEQKDIADEFNERASNLLEMSVNSHFEYVQWTMFREYQNGNREPFCECSHDGIPFSDLNSADKTNAGLDIINTLSRFYDIAAPIVIDNAEAVNTLLLTQGQQIRLYVSTDDTLVIR